VSADDVVEKLSPLAAIRRGLELLQFSPWSCRKAAPELPRHRELLVPFGSAG